MQMEQNQKEENQIIITSGRSLTIKYKYIYNGRPKQKLQSILISHFHWTRDIDQTTKYFLEMCSWSVVWGMSQKLKTTS